MSDVAEFVFLGLISLVSSYFYYKEWKRKGLQNDLMYSVSALILGIVLVLVGLWSLFARKHA